MGRKSGLTLDVAPGSKDLVVDLDRTEFDKALDATKKKTTKKKAKKA